MRELSLREQALEELRRAYEEHCPESIELWTRILLGEDEVDKENNEITK